MPELWLVDLQASAAALDALEREQRLLSADDRRRIARLGDAGERGHRRVAYIALRIVLERVAGGGVRNAKLLRPAGGKPRLAAGSATFSLSHTKGVALIAVARRGAIGVDVEAMRSIRLSGRRRAEVMAAGRGLAPAPLGDADDDAALLRAWVRLEAFAKAEGLGVARVLGSLGLRSAAGRTLALEAVEASMRHLRQAKSVTVIDLKLPAGLFGAFAVGRTIGRDTQPRRFPTKQDAVRDLLARRL